MIFYYQIGLHKKEITVGRSSKHGYPSHFHDYVEFLYLLDGHYSLAVDNEVYEIEAGDLAVIFPYQVHEYRQTDGSNKELVITAHVGFFPDFEKTLAESVPERHIIKKDEIPAELAFVLDWLSRTKSSDSNIFTVRKQLVNIVMWYVNELAGSVQKDKRKMNTLQKIVKYCAENFLEEDISLDKVSDALGFSKYYISHIISSEFKISFSRYINMIRINHACRLLGSTNKKIIDIAYESGYGTVRNFNRVFCEIKGVTPVEYRNSQTQKKTNRN